MKYCKTDSLTDIDNIEYLKEFYKDIADGPTPEYRYQL